MYKSLLCWRYLRTRYIALASIISVMLGVATMIVVNSVMAGFSAKMRDRLHGVLADVVVESYSIDGFYNHEEVTERILEVAGDRIAATAPTMETFALAKWTVSGQPFTRQVQLIGVEPESRAKTGDFAEFLVADQSGERIAPSFEISEKVKLNRPVGRLLQEARKNDPDDLIGAQILQDQLESEVPDHGAIIGFAVGHLHRDGKDYAIAPPGTRIGLVFPSAGQGKPKPEYDDYTVVGYFKSDMSEYDSQHVYIPLRRLQYMRGLINERGRGAVNAIQIKVKPGVDLDALARSLQGELEKLQPNFFRVATWEEKQGPLLAAVAVEQSILNILLFFIIAVAGFGILGIFSMIVVEKTRDIGILKALGASTAGVRGIFLGYGFSLGVVGGGVGLVGGLLFVEYINPIESALSRLTGRRVFDGDIYYFNEIPTLVQLSTVSWIVGGAIAIAMAASVWPAQRAAKLHPVQALRNE
ncbi:MAG: FtsX-like permease family protein [Isosphaeraceae bacterium]|nr:FtsX-like permease family protein [Isosphaeraceae bacterium]